MNARRLRFFLRHVGEIRCAGALCGCRYGLGHCQIWNGQINDGYGLFWNGNTDLAAHRLWFEHHHGPLAPEECVCHACDNRPCVRLDHLWKGDRTLNNADMVEKGRRAPFSGEKNGRARLAEADIHEIFRLRLLGVSNKTIAKKYDVGQSHITGILSGAIWADVSKEDRIAYQKAYDAILSANLSQASRGEGNAQTKITEADVVAMRQFYRDGTHTCIRLGKMFGLGDGHVNQIIFGKKWSHVPGALPESMRRGPGRKRASLTTFTKPIL